MLHPSTKKLIDRLAEMTQRGKLNWVEGEDKAITYVTEGYNVILTSAPDELVILSKDGKELERATADELAGSVSDTGQTYTDVVAAMAKEASRIARGTETAISTLLADIDVDDDSTEITVAADEADPLASEAEHTATNLEDIADDTSAVSADDIVMVKAKTAEAAPTIEDTPAEEAADDPSEDEADVTEAVARLASEVNGQRDDTPALETVAATLAATTLADTAQAATQNEPAAEVPVEAPLATQSEPTAYVPFGLETAEQDEVLAATEDPASAPAEIAEVDVELEPEVPVEAVEETTLVASETPETEEETVTAEPEEDPIEATEEATSDTIEAISEEAPPETISAVEEQAATSDTDDARENLSPAPAPQTFSSASVLGGGALSGLSDGRVSAVKTEPEQVADTVAPEETVSEELAAEPPVHETIPDPDQTAPRSYSLSGIGAGFGLGALKSTTEATGTPSITPLAGEEKIIIDATDDIPIHVPEDSEPEGQTASGLPDVATLEQPPVEAPETVAKPDEEEASKDTDVLKPRTRFNPWN